MTAIDIVAVPYSPDAEAYFSPIKLSEAMAAARLVVGARVGQVGEVLDHGVNGLLYEPGDATDLAARISQIIDSPDGGSSLGREARSTVLLRHTWRRNAERIIARAEQIMTTAARA